MLHNRIKTQLSAYLDDELSPRQKQRVKEHLAICEECHLLLQDLREVSNRVASLRQKAPKDLWLAIDAKLDLISPASQSSLVDHLWQWTWRWLQPIVKPVPIAVGTASIICGILLVLLLQQPQETSSQQIPIDVYLTVHTRDYSQESLVPDQTLNLEQQDDSEATEQEQEQTYDSEIDFYLTVYLGEDEI